MTAPVGSRDVLLVATGLLLTFYYVPSPEKAYESVDQITNEIYLGWFVRGLHKTSVDLMILFLLFHVIRVFITRAYRTPGELKWVSGSIVLFVTLAMGHATAHAGAGNPTHERSAVMIAPIAALAEGHAAEFGVPEYKGVVKESARLQISEQRGDRLVR